MYRRMIREMTTRHLWKRTTIRRSTKSPDHP
jgi:hypothetical protein